MSVCERGLTCRRLGHGSWAYRLMATLRNRQDAGSAGAIALAFVDGLNRMGRSAKGSTAPAGDVMTVLPDQARYSRRRWLSVAGFSGLSLPALLHLRSSAAEREDAPAGKAKACIIIYCWGGMSHLESWDLKPQAPKETRGEFSPIETATP